MGISVPNTQKEDIEASSLSSLGGGGDVFLFCLVDRSGTTIYN